MGKKTRTIHVGELARVEGEGALHVTVRGRRVTDIRLEILEPPRLFEGILQGRLPAEAPDIAARICGICPVSHQMATVHALERLSGVRVEGSLRDLRRLLACGERIESHTLHIFLLHAPDFLGLADGVALAKAEPETFRKGLALKRTGNAIVRALGGREVHPVNVRVGGFFRAPRREEVEGMRVDLERAVGLAEETVRWVAGFRFPELEIEAELVALRGDGEYPFHEGTIASESGLDLDGPAWEERLVERQELHSTALHAGLRGRGRYLVGPLARWELNRALVGERAGGAARAVGLEGGCRNPFRSIVVRAVETLHACEEALRIVDSYRPPAEAAVDLPVVAGAGSAAIEAPRGLLWHRYEVAADGRIETARIVSPTSQNQAAIESDLRRLVETALHLPDDELRGLCEQAIRNHDPCISCATHFLRLEIDRGQGR